MYAAFFLLYIFGSRAIFIPAGIAMGIERHLVLLVVFCLDILQIPLYYYIYEKGTTKIKFLNFFYSRLPTMEKVSSSSLMKFARSMGGFGVVFVAAMPAFGGGMWSSVLMAHLLRIEKKRSVYLLALGSLIGCLMVFYGIEGAIYLFRLVKR